MNISASASLDTKGPSIFSKCRGDSGIAPRGGADSTRLSGQFPNCPYTRNLGTPENAKSPKEGAGEVSIRRVGTLFLVALAVFLGNTPRAHAQSPTPTSAADVVSIEVGSVTGKRGEQVSIAVTLHAGSFAVAGVQNDISFFPGIVALVGCSVNPDIDKDLTRFGLSYSGLRAIVLGNNVDPIPDGAVVYTCTFNVQPGAALGDWPLTISRVVASSPAGEQLPVVGSDGVIVVPGARPTHTPTPTPTPVVPAIILDSPRAMPGEQVPVRAVLQTAGAVVASTQNDILFEGASITVAATTSGTPDCLPNPDLDKAATAFAFEPPGCVGSGCTAVRVLVLSFSNVDPIPNGSTLYTCMVNVSEDAAPLVEHPLGIDGVILSDPSGQPVPDSIGVAGRIFVIPPAPTPTPVQPAVVVDAVSGDPGQDVLLTARLVTAGAGVAGTQNDIVFDSLNTPIAALANGQPQCNANPDIDKAATAFAFQPPGCSGSACTAIRAIVLSTENVAPIADGAVLYTCTISIAPTAATGVYPLSITDIALSTPDGLLVPSATTSSSAVLVGVDYPHFPPAGDPGTTPEPAATSSPSRTAGPTGTPTSSAPRTATASPRAATGSNGGATAAFSEGGGCSLQAGNDRGGAALLLLSVVGFLRRAKVKSPRRP
jgi:hypothetical protein